MKTDKGQFDALLSHMISTPPKKTAEIKAPKKAKAKRPKPNQK